ncbi:predicted protein [Histoplasma capsulatum H143]|uniref:Uncharacterized protein n=1 Tax=Ajellomyces capsulatus (strain H143) TaxID=544712 RepID=C6H706_AJECH|nr:predicted protein [Histoplasma capsulatum H143]
MEITQQSNPSSDVGEILAQRAYKVYQSVVEPNYRATKLRACQEPQKPIMQQHFVRASQEMSCGAFCWRTSRTSVFSEPSLVAHLDGRKWSGSPRIGYAEY